MTNRNVPNVLLVTERFTALAKVAMAGKGMPDQRHIVLPGNPEFASDAELQAMAERYVHEIVALISPKASQAVGLHL